MATTERGSLDYTDVNCCIAKCDLILTNNNELDYKAYNTPITCFNSI